MVSRKRQGEEKSRCMTVFLVPIDITVQIPLSVSCKPSDFKKLEGYIRILNANPDISKGVIHRTNVSEELRAILFEKLNIKTKKDFNNLMSEPISLASSIFHVGMQKHGINKINPFSSTLAEAWLKKCAGVVEDK